MLVRRRLLNLLTAVSVLLSTAAIVLWVRSYSGGDALHRLGPTQELKVISRSGKVGFERWVGTFGGPGTFGTGQDSSEQPDAEFVEQDINTESTSFGWSYDRPANDPLIDNTAWWNRVGFDAYRGETLITHAFSPEPLWTGRLAFVTVPWWTVATAAGLLPCIRAVRLIRRVRIENRLRLGHCPTCGYDLRGSQGRCPECGIAAGGSAA